MERDAVVTEAARGGSRVDFFEEVTVEMNFEKWVQFCRQEKGTCKWWEEEYEQKLGG